MDLISPPSWFGMKKINSKIFQKNKIFKQLFKSIRMSSFNIWLKQNILAFHQIKVFHCYVLNFSKTFVSSQFKIKLCFSFARSKGGGGFMISTVRLTVYYWTTQWPLLSISYKISPKVPCFLHFLDHQGYNAPTHFVFHSMLFHRNCILGICCSQDSLLSLYFLQYTIQPRGVCIVSRKM